jgi:hypothetical protein
VMRAHASFVLFWVLVLDAATRRRSWDTVKNCLLDCLLLMRAWSDCGLRGGVVRWSAFERLGGFEFGRFWCFVRVCFESADSWEDEVR